MKRIHTRLSGTLLTIAGAVYMFMWTIFYEVLIAFVIFLLGLSIISLGEEHYS